MTAGFLYCSRAVFVTVDRLLDLVLQRGVVVGLFTVAVVVIDVEVVWEDVHIVIRCNYGRISLFWVVPTV